MLRSGPAELSARSCVMDNALGGLVDALPGCVWTALPDGHCDFVNERWREYTGLALESAAGEGRSILR